MIVLELDHMTKKRVFSGIQPSGDLHIGNYIGAVKQWVNRQDQGENYFCVVDLHAITVLQDPKILKAKVRELSALYLACGIDAKKSVMFVQSDNPDHASLAWVLNCYAGMGQLERMTQFKEKAGKQEQVTVGLFDYPVLMAADILLYDTDEVPVGEDQKQHVELTRDLAERFNSKYESRSTNHEGILKVPEVVIPEMGARIMSLQDPTGKMSKSDANPNGAIGLLDDLDVVAKKIKRAVTDSGDEIRMGEDKPAISNLLTIFEELSGQSVQEISDAYSGKGYGIFKQAMAEVVVEALRPIQERYREVQASGELDEVLENGAERAREVSGKTLQRVCEAVGLR
jgi:tryptophanyl-tRNA synthetase